VITRLLKSGGLHGVPVIAAQHGHDVLAVLAGGVDQAGALSRR
jgi:hypothetical protein